MAVSRGKAGAALLAVAASVAGFEAVAQRVQGLSGECRRELMSLCADGDIRSCVRAQAREFSDTCRAEFRELAQHRSRAERTLPAGAEELAFGADPLQRLDFVPAPGAAVSRPARTIVSIHGGGWSIGDKRHGLGQKATHFTAAGFAVALLNYRLVPQATVEQQAEDVAAALAYLRAGAGRLGIDPDGLVLIGHSAGAHLAALMGTDTSYLARAGVPVGAVHPHAD